MARATLIFFMLAAQAASAHSQCQLATAKTTVTTALTLSLLSITSSVRQQSVQEGGENMDKDTDEVERENQASFEQPEELAGDIDEVQRGNQESFAQLEELAEVNSPGHHTPVGMHTTGWTPVGVRMAYAGTDTTWPGNDPAGVPIELGDKVRNLANNDVGKIVALKSASAQHSLKFLSDEHPPGGVYWLQPSVISHVVVGYEWIPPHQGQYHLGDEVIVIDPANKWARDKIGTIGVLHSASGDTGSMRVDFGSMAAVTGDFGWFTPSQLQFANKERRGNQESFAQLEELAEVNTPGLFKEGDKVMVTDLVAKDNPWAAGKEGTVVPGRPAGPTFGLDPDPKVLVTFGSDRSGWFKPSQLKHGEDIPPLQGDFKEGDKVMVIDRVIVAGNEWATGKEGTVVPGKLASGDTGMILVEFLDIPGMRSVGLMWMKPSQLKHAN